MLAYLLQGLILGGTAAAQPGPLQAFLMSLVARTGWQRTVPAAFAPLISDGPILILVLLLLVRLPERLLAVLQICGGLFLIYLAWGAWRSYRQATRDGAAAAASTDSPLQTGILKAALMNFLSPAPYLFWATIAGPILIEGWRQAPALGLSFLLGFYAALIGGLMIFIALFAAAGGISPRINQALGAVSAFFLLGFGVFQLYSGIDGFGAVVI